MATHKLFWPIYRLLELQSWPFNSVEIKRKVYKVQQQKGCEIREIRAKISRYGIMKQRPPLPHITPNHPGPMREMAKQALKEHKEGKSWEL